MYRIRQLTRAVVVDIVAGLTRRSPSVYAEYNIHSQQTQSLAVRNTDDDLGIY